MNRTAAAALLCVLIMIPCVIGHMVVRDCDVSMNALLDKAISSAEQGDYDGARRYCETAEYKYVRLERRLSLFIHHESVENLGVSISRLPSLAGEESVHDFLAEAHSAKTMIQHIVNDEIPIFVNIF